MNLKTILIFLFLTSSAYAEPNYGPAIDAAKTAYLIQSGWQAKIDMVRNYTSSQGKLYLHKFKIEKEVGVVAFCWNTYKFQTLTFPVSENKRLTLTPNSVTLGINF